MYVDVGLENCNEMKTIIVQDVRHQKSQDYAN